MYNQGLVAKDYEANKSCLFVLSRNSHNKAENMFKNLSIRDVIQSFFDKLVVEGVIAYQANTSGEALFKVKGVDEIQKVSTKYYVAEADYFFNWYKDEPTIEDLLTLAANKNDIELPSILKPRGYEFTTAERSKQVACYIMLGFALVNKPRVAAPVILGSLITKEVKDNYDLKNADCPTPKLK